MESVQISQDIFGGLQLFPSSMWIWGAELRSSGLVTSPSPTELRWLTSWVWSQRYRGPTPPVQPSGPQELCSDPSWSSRSDVFVLRPTGHTRADLISPFHCLFVDIVNSVPQASLSPSSLPKLSIPSRQETLILLSLQIYIFYYKNESAELKITCYKKQSIKE